MLLLVLQGLPAPADTGGYAVAAPDAFLMTGRDGAHPTEIARLRGARLVVCSEQSSGRRFDEPRVKRLTGGDILTGRYMRGDFFDFTPSHLLVIASNHLPQVRDGGPSFWRRVRLIPFTHVVPEHRRDPDLHHRILHEEGPAVLGWAVRGAITVLRDGLGGPARGTDRRNSRRPPGRGASVQHPHRGFETDTIVYEGQVEHRDSTGAGGRIGPGDVQWMTAASGILHEEFHSHEFTRTGGTLEMVQLWVNLPARDKMTTPGYQALLDADIPSVVLPGEAGRVRVIAGEYDGHAGPARTFTAMNVWDVRLGQGRVARFQLPEGHTAALVVLRGTVEVNGREIAREAQMVMLDRAGQEYPKHNLSSTNN